MPTYIFNTNLVPVDPADLADHSRSCPLWRELINFSRRAVEMVAEQLGGKGSDAALLTVDYLLKLGSKKRCPRCAATLERGFKDPFYVSLMCVLLLRNEADVDLVVVQMMPFKKNVLGAVKEIMITRFEWYPSANAPEHKRTNPDLVTYLAPAYRTLRYATNRCRKAQ